LLFRNVQTIDTLIETGDSEQIFQKAIQEQGRGQVCWSLVPPLALFFFGLFFLIYSMRGQPNWFWTHNKRWSLLFLQFLNFHPPLLDFKPETFKLNSQVSTAGMSPREDFERGPKNVWCWVFLLQFFWLLFLRRPCIWFAHSSHHQYFFVSLFFPSPNFLVFLSLKIIGSFLDSHS
jgi:hypothetical protein